MKKTAQLIAVLGTATSAIAQMDTDVVYTMTNNPTANEVIAFKAASNGSLTMIGSFKTGGKGITGDVDDQHSLMVSKDLVFAANPGSNDITVLKKIPNGLKMVGKYSSGGNNPVSLSISGNMLVVANQAVKEGIPNLTSFQIGKDGSLKMMDKAKMTFAAGAGPADVSISPDGKKIAVSYGYQSEETAMVAIMSMDSAGMMSKMSEAPAYGPVGLSWNPAGNHVYVSTFRGASVLSFKVSKDGKLSDAEKLMDTESAACWATVNKAGTRLYLGNFVSNSISTYALDENGEAKFISATKRPNVSGNDTKDIVLSADGKFLRVLGTDSRRIDTFTVKADGTVEFLSSTTPMMPMMGKENWKGLAGG